jgi:Flp pilus assembly protein TadD
MGIALAARGDHSAALPHLREAVRLQPEDAGMRANLERTLRAMGRDQVDDEKDESDLSGER